MRDGIELPLRARSFDLLVALAKRAGRLVTKDELLELVWRGVVVEENNIAAQIVVLRKALGAELIATVPGRGYRFTAEVRQESSPGARAAPLETAASQSLPAHAVIEPTTGSQHGNLPARLPPLYGREADLARLGALLDEHSIVSLVATGGVGKTHLARTLAGSLRPSFADGVWCVELASHSDGDFIAHEVARVLGFQVPLGRAAVDVVVDVLRTQRSLLLLDNCEHLLPAVAGLVKAIHEASPQVRILVTSQQPLGLRGEYVYRLGTLALPQAPGLEAARDSGAVQLLVHRIQAVVDGFSLSAANAMRLAAVCRHLDGIPLALEFAAARVPVLGLDGLLARLDARFKVLTASSPHGLHRHQTLLAALEFSHGLLQPDEQAVFRRIGVFQGSFSADAAQEVASDESIDPWAVLDHLGALIAKSLLLADGGDRSRLRLLETTRAYALNRLAEAGETADWQQRHARATAALIARSADDYWLLSDDEMRERYGPEHANMRAAMDWALVHDGELAIEIAGNACALWREAWSLQPEGARYCEAALKHLGDRTPAQAAGRLYFALGWMLIWSHQQRGRAAALRAAELLRQTDDRATLGMTLLLLIPGTTPPDADQEAVLRELHLLYDKDAPPRVQAACVSAFARFAMGSRQWEEASRLYSEARALLVSCGSVQWEGVLSWTMASIALTRGIHDFAADTLRDAALRLEAAPTHGIFLAFCLGTLATAHLLRGDVPAARAALARTAPLIAHFDLGSRYAGTAAWLAIEEGRWQAATCLLGYYSRAAETSGVDAEEPAEVSARERVASALAGHADASSIAAWMLEGRTLSTMAAYELALGHDSPAALRQLPN